MRTLCITGTMTVNLHVFPSNSVHILTIFLSIAYFIYFLGIYLPGSNTVTSRDLRLKHR